MTAPLLRAYVDETGDRGMGAGSSEFFSFACMLIPDEDEPQMRAAMSRLRSDLGVPKGKALHWKDHVKTHSRRQHVTNVLTTLPTVSLTYVVVEKSAIPAAAGMRQNHVVFYNFASGLVLERILLAARGWPGGYRDAVVRFGHVRGFNHASTTDYFSIKQYKEGHLPWARLRGPVHFDGMGNWDGLQAADQYAGMLSAAMRPDAFGNYESQHFVRVCQTQLRRKPAGKAEGWGFKLLGNRATMQAYPWWPLTAIE